MAETNSKLHKTGIIIVSFNSSSDLKKCIKSINEQSTLDNSLIPIVVDNQSSDNSVQVAKDAGAKVIENAKNLGFAKAVNIGIEEAFRQGSDHILIFNPDASLQDDSINQLFQTLTSSTRVGAVGPSMMDEKGEESNSHYYLKAPGFFSVLFFSTFLRPWALRRKSLLRFYSHTDLANEVQEVDQIPGACLLIPRVVLEDVGLLDEDFAIWFEDVEWSYRAKKKGYSLLFCPEAHVEHEGGVSFDKWRGPEKTITFLVSMKTFFRKHKPLRLPLIVAVLSINYFFVFLKTGDKDWLRVINKLILQKKGTLPN